jgi:hypothetical protein
MLDRMHTLVQDSRSADLAARSLERKLITDSLYKIAIHWRRKKRVNSARWIPARSRRSTRSRHGKTGKARVPDPTLDSDWPFYRACSDHFLPLFSRSSITIPFPFPVYSSSVQSWNREDPAYQLCPEFSQYSTYSFNDALISEESPSIKGSGLIGEEK